MTVVNEFYHSRLGQTVEVSTEQQVDVVRTFFMTVRSEVVAASLGDLPQLLHQHHRLYELHVTELWVPVDVGRADQNVLADLLVVWRDSVLPARLLGLQQSGQGDVVLGHDPVQHVLVPVSVLDGKLVELDQLFLINISLLTFHNCLSLP